jgi:hypothetical protein
LGEEHVAEGSAESTDAGEGSDADGDGDDDEEKAGARGSDFPPTDADGRGPGELRSVDWHWLHDLRRRAAETLREHDYGSYD